MRTDKLISFLTLLFLLFLFNEKENSQTINGYTGLLTIPSAETASDASLRFGMSFFDKNAINYGKLTSHKILGFLNFAFLPFLEINLKITRNLQPSESEAIGDRTPSIRLKLMNERKLAPAVLVGWHDVLSVFGGSDANHFNSLYLVVTKNINIINSMKVGLVLGYGTTIIQAANHEFVGLFGGVALKIFNTIELMEEYDGTYSNSGISIKLFNHFSFLGGLLRNKYFSGGASYFFSL